MTDMKDELPNPQARLIASRALDLVAAAEVAGLSKLQTVGVLAAAWRELVGDDQETLIDSIRRAQIINRVAGTCARLRRESAQDCVEGEVKERLQ